MVFSRKARKDYRDMTITMKNLEQLALNESLDDSIEGESTGGGMVDIDFGDENRPSTSSGILRNRSFDRVENLGRSGYPHLKHHKF